MECIFFFLSISLVVIFMIILPISEAKVGYSIDVTVNNSTAKSEFSRSQSTNVLRFTVDSACSGNGNSSKYKKIDGFAGIGIKDTTYARKGRMIAKETLKLSSTVNWIKIYETVSGLPLNETPDQGNSAVIEHQTDHYTAEINESIPTILLDRNEIYYRGDGINTRNEYRNNGDEFVTNYYATALTKSEAYAGVYNNALILADIIPGRVNAFVGQNFSSVFRLSSASDRYSGFGFASGNEFMEETYLGSFNIDTKIIIVHKFKL